MICPSCRAENDDAAEVCLACRSPLSAVAPGTVVHARYEIGALLGRGGVGVVYRAHDRILNEDVALKVLRGDVADTPEVAGRFRQEIRLGRRVVHPGVCRIYDYGEDAGLRYISMELIDGIDLRELVRREGPLPGHRACALAAEVADALQAIHEAGIVHRDLKPMNVMLDAAGRVRVMDFGIAKAFRHEDSPTATGYVVGSPEYMSPEQARGRKADPRSDIYSLGVLLYELVTGRVPFRSDDPVTTLLMQVEEPPPLDSPEARALPEPIRQVLRRALAKEPAERYTSAREMAEALRRAAPPDSRSSTAMIAHAPSGSIPGRRGRLAITVVVVLAALGIAALIRSGLASRPEERVTAITPTPGVSPEVFGAVPTLPLASPALPAPSPTGGGPARPAAVSTHIARSPAPAADPPRPAAAAIVSAASPEPSAITGAPPREPATTTASESPPALSANPTPGPAASVVPQKGLLRVAVTPWAHVSVDGVAVGETPLREIPLALGPHDVVLTHPDYRPYLRRVTIVAGQPFRLVVDLRSEGVRRQP